MKTQTLFEHETTQNFIPTDEELNELDRLSTALGVSALQYVRVKGKGELRAAQYVGVVRLGKRAIQILPKIYPVGEDDNREEHAKYAMSNLLYLLSYAGKLQIRDYQIASLLRRNSDWFEVLIYLFATNLNKEWQRGANRNYNSVEDELPLLKGKLRVIEQLRRPERLHLFSVKFDEFTVDNALNRVFRFVIERLYNLTLDAENRKQLSILKQQMEFVTLPSSVSVRDADAILLTRLNKQYEPLLNLARMFLNKGAIQLSSGDIESFAFVFDMNKLFESFIVSFMKRHQEDILSAELQECELIPQSRGLSFHLATKEGKPQHLLKPDLMFRKDDQNVLLLDTKYKSTGDRGGGSDVGQMINYTGSSQCPRAVLLYPQTSDMSEPLKTPPSTGWNGARIVTATIDLRIEIGRKAGRAQLISELKNILQD